MDERGNLASRAHYEYGINPATAHDTLGSRSKPAFDWGAREGVHRYAMRGLAVKACFFVSCIVLCASTMIDPLPLFGVDDDRENLLPEVNEEAKKMAARRLDDFRRKSMHRFVPLHTRVGVCRQRHSFLLAFLTTLFFLPNACLCMLYMYRASKSPIAQGDGRVGDEEDSDEDSPALSRT